MKLCAECALQQVIQIIAKTYETRKAKGLTPITIGRLKNRFHNTEGKTHLTVLTTIFTKYPDNYYIIIDKGGYIAVFSPGDILASRIRI